MLQMHMLQNKAPCWLSDIVSSLDYQESSKELSIAFSSLEWKKLLTEKVNKFSLNQWLNKEQSKSKLCRLSHDTSDWLVKHISTNFVSVDAVLVCKVPTQMTSVNVAQNGLNLIYTDT